MNDAQELFRLIGEAGRLKTAVEAAERLDGVFSESVKAMLAGTGKPVTPEEAEKFSELIATSKEAQGEQLRRLASTVREIATIVAKRFPSVADDE